jgi:signal peptidase I
MLDIAWNFSTFLTFGTLLVGLIVFLDHCWLKPRRLVSINLKEPWLVEQARSFFPVLLVVLLLRSFLAEPFRIPSGSMKPGLLEGDFIAVNKYAYGLRLPVLRHKLIAIGEPQRGDVVVFHAPFDISQDFIKRLVGLPGDKIEYKDKVLYVNGKPQPQDYLGVDYDIDLNGASTTVQKYLEDLEGVPHEIFVRSSKIGQDIPVFVVPAGHYFMVGDNRDNSADGRVWGFVPDKNIVGKAFLIWMSWDSLGHTIRFHRIGSKIR